MAAARLRVPNRATRVLQQLNLLFRGLELVTGGQRLHATTTSRSWTSPPFLRSTVARSAFRGMPGRSSFTAVGWSSRTTRQDQRPKHRQVAIPARTFNRLCALVRHNGRVIVVVAVVRVTNPPTPWCVRTSRQCIVVGERGIGRRAWSESFRCDSRGCVLRAGVGQGATLRRRPRLDGGVLPGTRHRARRFREGRGRPRR